MFFFKTLIILLALAAAALLLVRFFEPRLIYFPYQSIDADPGQSGLRFEDVYFETSDGERINAWFLPAEGARETVLFCHGNAGNIGHRMGKLIFFHDLGLNVFIFDYRGYGKSGGVPSEQGFYRDAEAAYRYLISRGIPANQIIGYGESIGGAVAVDLSLRHPMRAIVLENTFTSVKDMVRRHYPFIPYQALSSRFDTGRKIASVKVPKLLIHSGQDEIVPFLFGERLFKEAAPPKEFLKIWGSHNEGFFDSEPLIRERLSDFISRLDRQ